ncbi:MAG: DNA polymerase [Eubacteriales bacterium]
MRHLSIDIETFSSVDIKKSGLYKYVQSPDFQVLLFAYSLDNTPVRIIDLAQGESIPGDVVNALFSPDVVKQAYNASFEWYCLSKYFNVQPSPEVWLSQWRCTQIHGLYCGYTAGLAATGEALGLPQDKRKLGTGAALIRTFCVPCKPSKTNGYRSRTLPHHEPEKWQLFKDYCVGDVVAEMEIERRLSAFPVSEQEQRMWELDQVINSRGVAVDLQLVDGALAVSEAVTDELRNEASDLTTLNNPNSVSQLLSWYEEETGQDLDNLRKDTVKALLSGDIVNEAVRRVLEIRQELAKTSVTKYAAMREAVCEDGRIRGLLQFYGANRTGRWAGRLVQVQNLPKNHDSYINKTMDFARRCVEHRDVEALRIIYGNIPDTLSQLIRTAFVPAPGHTFLVADFSAIEARVIAWLAGEQWRQEVFATHGKIYEASASAMFGVDISLIRKGNPEYELRQKGKIAELALGYQGAVGALKKMGALEMGLAEEDLSDIKTRWRQANKRIVDLWYAVEGCALNVMKTGQPSGVRGLIFAREGDYSTDQDFLTVILPSGRKLFYVKPFISPNQWGEDALRYSGMDQKTKKWAVVETYGGKLVENIVQAIARDCLAESISRLEAAGYPVVMHVHDECVIDLLPGVDAETELEVVCGIMGEPISWAPGLLLRADGFVTGFYRKE